MNSLKELFKQLNNNRYYPFHSNKNLLKSYYGTDWRYLINTNVKSQYTYCRHMVYSNDIMTMYLIRWPHGYISNLHTHGAGCLYKVLEGRLLEYKISNFNMENGYTKSSTIHNIGSVNFLNGTDSHTMSNIYECPATSLHVYEKSDYNNSMDV
jgi:predicted metal-dependent enzyme (double-stranded beta helix superfamily)